MKGSFDRKQTKMYPLSSRDHKLCAKEIAVNIENTMDKLDTFTQSQIKECAQNIKTAKSKNKPVMLTYGAHLIKNGASPVIVKMINEGWVDHIAVNGAGSIHDWEFAYIGLSTEDVRKNTATGSFGTWDETGKYINLAVAVGGIQGLGHGESVGKMIDEDSLIIPSADKLKSEIINEINHGFSDTTAAKCDLLNLINDFNIKEGKIEIKHCLKEFSVQYAAWKANIGYTVHPGIGYDIIYTHPYNNGGAIGRGATKDFLCFADSVSKLGDGGIHLTVGSAIMAPMIFEKSMSMANNLALNSGKKKLENFHLAVVDIQDGGNWDWSKGEPPMNNPAYYLRFCKSFYRMGGKLDYICVDNRDFIINLYCELVK